MPGFLGYQNLTGQSVSPSSGHFTMAGWVPDSWSAGTGRQNTNQNNNGINSANTNFMASMYGDPFGTAMSGTQKGTLQPYVNRMTQNASNALYGGLLGYSPQSIVAGDAGGTPVNSTPPQFNLPSAIPQTGQGLNFTGFGNRSWMGK